MVKGRRCEHENTNAISSAFICAHVGPHMLAIPQLEQRWNRSVCGSTNTCVINARPKSMAFGSKDNAAKSNFALKVKVTGSDCDGTLIVTGTDST